MYTVWYNSSAGLEEGEDLWRVGVSRILQSLVQS
jgi:hypothetical protein